MTSIVNNNLSPIASLSSVELESLYANAWVQCGVSADTGESYNISSLTDVGTGKLGVSFTSAMIDTDYSALAFVQIGANTNQTVYQVTSNLTSSRSDFEYAGAAADPGKWAIVITGAQL